MEGTPQAETTGRFRGLPTREVLGAVYPVAVTLRTRLLGLSFLDLDDAGSGLLIPRCRSIHTLGMRFPVDLYFLGVDGEPVGARYGVGPWRFVRNRAARSVLEVPSERGAPRRVQGGGGR
jgi:hypothetical protein